MFAYGLKPFGPADQNRNFANIVDPDETARYEPSHLTLQCLPSESTLFAILVLNLDRNPYLHQWVRPNSKMEESKSESKGWKG